MDVDIYDDDLDEGVTDPAAAAAADGKGQPAKDAGGEPKKSAAPRDDKSVKDEPNKGAEPGKKEGARGKVLSDEEYQSFRAMEQERQLKELETDFKKEYGDFNMQKVLDKMFELDEKNKGYLEKNFNPTGIENVYLKYFKDKAPQDDEYDVVHGKGGSAIDRGEMARRINKGEISQEEKLAYLSKIY